MTAMRPSRRFARDTPGEARAMHQRTAAIAARTLTPPARTVAARRTNAARATAGRRSLFALVALLAACASHPPPPDWQSNAQGGLARAQAAWLQGNPTLEAREFERARREVASTGRLDWVARAELMRCAAHVASLEFAPCAGFDALRADAAPAEAAYAAYLSGAAAATDVERLPSHHRAVALAATPEAALVGMQRIDDPLARLVAAAVLLRSQRASPGTIVLAIDTASAQGWRRPLLAWLGVQAQRAEVAGDAAALAQIRRRIALVEGTR